MSLINPIKPVDAVQTRLPESTGVLGFHASPAPVTVAAVMSSYFGGGSRGGTETTGVNSFSSFGGSSSGSSGGGGGLNVTI